MIQPQWIQVRIVTAATAMPIAHMSDALMNGCDSSSSMAFTRRYVIE